MRQFTFIACLALTATVRAQEPAITPTEELRTTVGEWVETMRKIQQEENDWARDQEILQNYKEGLETEITSLKQQIADARTRKDGIDKESADKSAERDRYAAAKDELTTLVRRLEESLEKRLPLFPGPLLAEPKVAQGLEDLKRDLALPADKRGEGVTRRLLNVINLTSEAEKFQQTVHIRPDLFKDGKGREFNMKVIYFGLAVAYAVNDDATFALVGKPGDSGWKFDERPELAADIAKLIATTVGDLDAAFISLPFAKP